MPAASDRDKGRIVSLARAGLHRDRLVADGLHFIDAKTSFREWRMWRAPAENRLALNRRRISRRRWIRLIEGIRTASATVAPQCRQTLLEGGRPATYAAVAAAIVGTPGIDDYGCTWSPTTENNDPSHETRQTQSSHSKIPRRIGAAAFLTPQYRRSFQIVPRR